MKRMKKLAAMLLALAMVLGMTITAFGAQVTEKTLKLNVSGLTAGETQNVKIYQAAAYDDAGKWVVADWVGNNYTVDENNSANVLSINWKDLTAPAIPYAETDVAAEAVSAQLDVAPGAYLVVIATTTEGSKTVYANAGDVTEWKDGAFQNIDVVAKSSNADTTKKVEGDDDKEFVSRGEKVPFVIETIFPYFDFSAYKDGAKAEYYILDTAEGLENLENVTVEVTIGSTAINTLKWVKTDRTDKDQYKLDLSAYATEANTYAGQKVTVKYTATVVDDEKYFNGAQSIKDGKDIKDGEDPVDPNPTDPDPNWPKGELGKITITKKDAENGNLLNDATFNVFKVDASGNKIGDAIKFVPVEGEVGTYKKAMEDEDGSADVTTAGGTETAPAGLITLKGLDEGTYLIEETKAPAGYTINASIETKVMSEETKLVEFEVLDTTLTSLPSTGGMGTMIFTIGGCIIMIVAAGLYFASRRKSAK